MIMKQSNECNDQEQWRHEMRVEAGKMPLEEKNGKNQLFSTNLWNFCPLDAPSLQKFLSWTLES